MSDGTITYDYAAIEDCLTMMLDNAEGIMQQADALETSVKTIMTDWQGSTADAYQQLATDLDKDLVAQSDFLKSLKMKFEAAAEAMQNADKGGAGGMGR